MIFIPSEPLPTMVLKRIVGAPVVLLIEIPIPVDAKMVFAIITLEAVAVSIPIAGPPLMRFPIMRTELFPAFMACPPPEAPVNSTSQSKTTPLATALLMPTANALVEELVTLHERIALSVPFVNVAALAALVIFRDSTMMNVPVMFSRPVV
jgi:hypothetical protein